jgi:predicted DsbA family dithiol-disulfide isomerase
MRWISAEQFGYKVTTGTSAASLGEPMHVEIWSDIACPWCYVGKRRFETALASFEHRDEVSVTWRSFELDPGAPRTREGDGADHLARKYGTSREQALAMHANMTAVGADEGLELRFDIARGGNTFDAHRLVQLAAAHDLQDEMQERLFRAYFGEGVAIGEPAALEPLATEVGLSAEEVRDVLVTERYAEEVRHDEREASELGITAVPFFAVDRAIGVAGAHPPELLGKVLAKGWEAAAART